LVVTISHQSAGASKRLYTRYFKSNPSARALLRDVRIPFKDWAISRQYTVKVCPKTLRLSVEPQKNLELILNPHPRLATAFMKTLPVTATNNFVIDLLGFVQKVVERANALKVLQPYT